MIAFDFTFYRPASVEEAVLLYQQLVSDGGQPLYFSGGTEIITRARADEVWFDAVIDIKDIFPCNACQYEGEELVTGAGVTLTKVAESGLFPFLTAVLCGIADHTSRNKITLGGNLCSNLPYRESILPLLLCDSQMVIAGVDGLKKVFAKDIFDQTLRLQKGEFLLQVRTGKQFLKAPYVHIRKTKQTKIDYPLVTIAMMAMGGEIRFACSGLHSHPFRSTSAEKILCNRSMTIEERAAAVTGELASGVIDDMLSSAAYRKFIFQQGLVDGLLQMEAVSG
jgi:CO/xanthine dehydrogenase FAD-binding subunit